MLAAPAARDRCQIAPRRQRGDAVRSRQAGGRAAAQAREPPRVRAVCRKLPKVNADARLRLAAAGPSNSSMTRGALFAMPTAPRARAWRLRDSTTRAAAASRSRLASHDPRTATFWTGRKRTADIGAVLGSMALLRRFSSTGISPCLGHFGDQETPFRPRAPLRRNASVELARSMRAAAGACSAATSPAGHRRMRIARRASGLTRTARLRCRSNADRRTRTRGTKLSAARAASFDFSSNGLFRHASLHLRRRARPDATRPRGFLADRPG